MGRRDIMAHFDKSDAGADKWLMQLGTLSGNPIAAAAGLKSLEILNREGLRSPIGIGQPCQSNDP